MAGLEHDPKPGQVVRRLAILLASLALLALPQPGAAQPKPPPNSDVSTDGSNVLSRAWTASKSRGENQPERTGPERDASGSRSRTRTGPNPLELQRQITRAVADFKNKVQDYEERVGAYQFCVYNGGSGCTPPGVIGVNPLAAPNGAIVRAAPGPPDDPTPAITITPQQAAYIAVARLTLTPPAPGIGPPPSINKWKMAAVGYPLWLWAEGTTDPPPVSDAVAGLSVSLDARVDRMVFVMGDGRSKTCQGTGTEWTRSVRPGAESPTCGYRYERPSLPRGKYTVTAQTRWMVDWTINGVSGSIPIVQEASTQLPVGELQSLVR